MRVVLHPEARGEFRAATLWYEERRDRLGDDFIAAIDATSQRISQMPESFPPWPGVRRAFPVIRKAAVERFPYLIAFEQHEDFALVLGVVHEKRRPLSDETDLERADQFNRDARLFLSGCARADPDVHVHVQ